MEALVGIAAEQHALFTSEQWRAAGRSRRQLRYRLASGVVREMHPGVYALGGAPETLEQNLLAACLSSGGVASHRCAAHLWGFRKFEIGSVEVLVRKDHTPCREGVTVRRTGRLDGADIDTCRGIPITGRARTLLDLCDVAPTLAEGALNRLLHQRRLGVRQLQAVLGRVGPQHPGSVLYRKLLAPFTQGQRPTESELEDDFLDLVIRRYGLPMPVRQHPVGRGRIDFAYPELMLGMELQSVRAHAARDDVDRNASKANQLLEWWILQFVWNDVHLWPEDTAQLLDRTIAERRRAA